MRKLSQMADIITPNLTELCFLTDVDYESVISCRRKDDYIDKISFTAFDSVKEQIMDKKFVIVCGIEAHICVLQTVIDLVEAGFVPVVVEDCISSRKPNDKEVAIRRMLEEGAIVTTYESLLFELLKIAGTEESKRIQRLIK